MVDIHLDFPFIVKINKLKTNRMVYTKPNQIVLGSIADGQEINKFNECVSIGKHVVVC